jgi:hypothetical protein
LISRAGGEHVERTSWSILLPDQQSDRRGAKILDAALYQHRYRIYTPNIGPSNDVVVVEFEYEDLDEYWKMWAEWLASPLAAVFMPKWAKLVERGGCNEVWNLPEQRS